MRMLDFKQRSRKEALWEERGGEFVVVGAAIVEICDWVEID